ncbi:DNA methyltransferase [Zunongwangia sp. H14]|uniref:DNA methyltransferase n=1 Tax=Zunongwangia sp. H14 TaxID=3240792 RepID=UPI0035631EC1
MDKYYTVSEVADKFGVNPTTIRRWDKNGKFPSSRHPINNYRVYTEEQIKDLVQEIDGSIDYAQSEIKIYSEPIFESKNGKLFNEDVLDFFKNIETGSVDLIFADPPYNIKKAEWDTFSSQKEYVEWSMAWINEAFRVLSNKGSLYICGFSEILADIKWSASHLFKGCKWLVWFYRNKANLGNDWGRSHESILHFRKSKDYIFNIDEARIPYNQHTLKYPKRTQSESSQYSNGSKKKYVWEPNPKGAKPKDVFEIPTLSNGSWERHKHPTQKPVELLRKIILSSSNTDSTILDPFGGSGTTYAVAEAYKRKWIGNDLSLKYCNLIQNRISDKQHIERIISAKDEQQSTERRKKLRSK